MPQTMTILQRESTELGEDDRGCEPTNCSENNWAQSLRRLDTKDKLQLRAFINHFRQHIIANWSWRPQQLLESRVRCRQLEHKTGPLAETTLTLAMTELQVNQDFDAAMFLLSRLGDSEQNGSLGSSLKQLTRSAKLLNGSISTELAEADSASGLSALERAVWFAFLAPCSNRSKEALTSHLGHLDEFERLCPWWFQVPTVKALADVTRAVLAGSREAQDDGFRGVATQAIHAMPWLGWFTFRVQLCDSGESERLGGGSGTAAVEWSREQWWSLYESRTVRRTHLGSHTLRILDQWQQQLPEPLKSLVVDLRHRRHEHFPGSHHESPSLDFTASDFPAGWPLGETAESLWRWEIDFERRFWAARSRLASEVGTAPCRMWQELLRDIEGKPWFLASTWMPALKYWHAIALARTKPRDAEQNLSELLQSPIASAARAQLALLALQKHDWEQARHLMGEVEPDCPAAFYAQALLLAHQGEREAAEKRLSRLQELFGHTASPYVEAATRLRAQWFERSRDWVRAEQILREQLDKKPADTIAAARLGRILFKSTALHLPSPSRQWDQINTVLHRAQGVPWVTPYIRLADGLAPVQSLDEAADFIDSMEQSVAVRRAWGHFLARRALDSGDVDSAYRLVNRFGTRADSAQGRQSALILDAWTILTQQHAAASNAAPEQCSHSAIPWGEAISRWRQEARRLPPHLNDPAFRSWWRLMDFAEQLYTTKDLELVLSVPTLPQLYPVRLVASLWMNESQRSSAPVEELSKAVETQELWWTEWQRRHARLLLALARGSEAEVSACEPITGQDILNGPSDPAELWVILALARIRQGMVDHVLGMPILATDRSKIDKSWDRFAAMLRETCELAEAARQGDFSTAISKLRTLQESQVGE